MHMATSGAQSAATWTHTAELARQKRRDRQDRWRPQVWEGLAVGGDVVQVQEHPAVQSGAIMAGHGRSHEIRSVGIGSTPGGMHFSSSSASKPDFT